jgi:aminoglycoside/choline kinase family phosphotransferase
MDVRQQLLQAWVQKTLVDLNLPAAQGSLSVVSGDASFRRYFRQAVNGTSYIAVDAPPEKENSQCFVDVARSWFAQGVAVPEVLKADFEQGFMLLSDMGDQLLLPLLNIDSADRLYSQAMTSLLDVAKTSPTVGKRELGPYDQTLLENEMSLFTDWFLIKHLQLELTAQDKRVLDGVFELLRESALGQVQVPVHRDYHSRNIMVLKDQSLGIIDFQDAVLGPITYDLVSLLRDCYIAWPESKVDTWVSEYFTLAKKAGLIGPISEMQFKLWFDWMGLQRHIKIAGIFSRLSIRDGKSAYLDDIPQTLSYILHVSAEYDALSEFHLWLNTRILPLLDYDLPADTRP